MDKVLKGHERINELVVKYRWGDSRGKRKTRTIGKWNRYVEDKLNK